MHWTVSGHEGVKRILELQIKSGRFAHTYLFLGSENLGKKALSEEFASLILGAENLHNHPDFLLFNRQGEPSIEEVRQLIEQINLKPFFGDKKVVVINNAQNLNLQSQNALLKTLEEPPASAVIILVSSRPLLPTITSRALVLRFNRSSLSQISTPENDQLSKERWGQIKKSSRAEKLAAISNLSEMEAQSLTQAFYALANAEILSLKLEPQNFRFIRLLLEAAENLTRNFNKKLVIQKLFLSL